MSTTKKVFGKKASTTNNEQVDVKRRITADNKYLKGAQAKDIKSIITEDCVLWLDGDSIPYFAAALQDDNYVEVTHKSSGRKMEFANKTAFKGASRKEGVITQNCWLGVKNLEQQAKGKPEFKLEDFEITQNKRLVGQESTCMQKAVSYMKDYLDAILDQSGCKTMKVVIGSGLTHRHTLKLPQIYKGNRSSQDRPLLLSACREWVEANYDVYVAKGEESDDKCQREGYSGSLHFEKTSKYNKMLSAIDKDSLGLPCLNFNFQKKGPMWNNPNPWQVVDWEATGDVGEIEMSDGKCRTTSLLHIARQVCTVDSADNYSMYLHFPRDMQPKEKYSDAGFYKQFCILKTPEAVLSGIVERYYTTFPRGLVYTAHDGTDMNIDTMAYLEMIFSCVYMLRKPIGEETMKLWFDKYKVDYSLLVGNNVEKVLPFLPEEQLRTAVKENTANVDNIIALLSDKSGKAADKLQRKDEAISLLEGIKSLDNLFQQA